MEPLRSSLHRLAPVILSVLGFFGALLTIFAGLVALNHSVLPFKGWPLDAFRLNTGTQVLPRAPVETGRLRTASGGALAAASGASSPMAHVAMAAAPVLTPRPHVVVQVRTRTAHPVVHRSGPEPAHAPAVPTPAPVPVPAVPPPAPAPVATPVVSSPAPVARRPVTASRQPSTSTPAMAPGNGHGRGIGRAHAPGRLKKAAVAAARPAPAAVAAAAPAPAAVPAAGPGNGHGNGNGHGPPPWAHGHH